VTWWTGVKDVDAELTATYGFLSEVMPEGGLKSVSRATATIGLRTGR
jgi:hypothetical protein